MEIHVLCLKPENWLSSKRTQGQETWIWIYREGRRRKGEEHQSITKIKKLLAAK